MSALMDLRPQKMDRDAEEMLRHLKGSELAPRFSAGVWYFYPPRREVPRGLLGEGVD